MSGAVWSVVGVLGSAGIATIGTLWVARYNRKDSRSDAAQREVAEADRRVNEFIDQVQEQYKEDRMEWDRDRTRLVQTWYRERESLENRQSRTEARVEGLEAREAALLRERSVLLDYVYLLRSQVPPPPPEWPMEFLRRADGD